VSVRHDIARASGKLENAQVKTRTSIPLIMLVCALGISVAACGSSGSSSSSSSTPSTSSAPPASAPASASASPSAASSGSAVAQITANWAAFFNPTTPTAKRVSLLQNGHLFTSAIEGSSRFPGASTASAKVTKVTVISPTKATVVYSILLAGTPVLPNQQGVAVLEGGTWKVGDASFCALLTLENSGKPMAVCKSVV
jgi:hypothetical protein